MILLDQLLQYPKIDLSSGKTMLKTEHNININGNAPMSSCPGGRAVLEYWFRHWDAFMTPEFHRRGDSQALSVQPPLFSDLLMQGSSIYIVSGICCRPMPDRGIWTLECRQCHQEFILEVGPGQPLLKLVKTYTCPNCHQKPNPSPSSVHESWHQIKEFHAKH